MKLSLLPVLALLALCHLPGGTLLADGLASGIRFDMLRIACARVDWCGAARHET